MSAGVCGQNDYSIFGLTFTAWTLLSVVLLLTLCLFTAWRGIRR